MTRSKFAKRSPSKKVALPAVDGTDRKANGIAQSQTSNLFQSSQIPCSFPVIPCSP
jgi:hypothetical protein